MVQMAKDQEDQYIAAAGEGFLQRGQTLLERCKEGRTSEG